MTSSRNLKNAVSAINYKEYWIKKAKQQGLPEQLGYWAWILNEGVGDGQGFLNWNVKYFSRLRRAAFKLGQQKKEVRRNSSQQ